MSTFPAAYITHVILCLEKSVFEEPSEVEKAQESR